MTSLRTSAPPPRHLGSRQGALASVAASMMFAGIFLLAPALRDLTATGLLAWRLIATVPIIAIVLTLLDSWSPVLAALRRFRQRPALLAVLAVDSALIGLQLWLFGWAPNSGDGLQLALGYLLMPLVMALAGRALFAEELSPARRAAIALASVGVLAAVATSSAAGAATAAVAVGFPLYFVLRRSFALDDMGAVFLEFAVLLAFGVVALAVAPELSAPIRDDPAELLPMGLLGLLSAGGFLSYLLASQLLPLAVFGMLGYLEPVLLVLVAALALGEPLRTSDALTYGPIAAGLLLLALEAARQPGAS